jgi:hypothetical protein
LIRLLIELEKLINPSELKSLELPFLDLMNEESNLDAVLVAQKVVSSLYPGITTEELDIESANICMNLSTTHPNYSYLAGRILVSNLHKKTLNYFSEKVELLLKETTIINKDWAKWVLENRDELDKIIDYNRDYIYDYFGFKTLEKAYLFKSKNKVVERPQDMILRTAITLQKGNIEMIKNTYDLMSSWLLYSCKSNFIQFWNKSYAIIFLFSSFYQKMIYQKLQKLGIVVCTNFKMGRWNWY